MQLRTMAAVFLCTAIGQIADAQEVSESPTQLPPLLQVPDCTPIPNRNSQRSKRGVPDYDRSLIYLPETLPADDDPEGECAADRYWIAPAIYYGWTAPSTSFRLPNSFVNDGLAPPARIGYGLTAGGWFSDERKNALELGGLYLSQGVARTGPIAFVGPNGMTTANSEFREQYLTATAMLRRRLFRDEQFEFDLLLGYVYARVGEVATVAVDPNLATVGRARTNFHGRSLGFAGQYRYEEWTLNVSGTAALGFSFGHWNANGQNFDKRRFAVLPAVTMRLDRSICENGRAFVGYDFQYLSRAARAADNLPVFNGPMAVQPRQGEFWFQALNAGVEVRF